MARTALTLQGIETHLQAAKTLEVGELYAHLQDLDSRFEEYNFSPERQAQIDVMRRRVQFELAARAVEDRLPKRDDDTKVDFSDQEAVDAFVNEIRMEIELIQLEPISSDVETIEVAGTNAHATY